MWFVSLGGNHVNLCLRPDFTQVVQCASDNLGCSVRSDWILTYLAQIHWILVSIVCIVSLYKLDADFFFSHPAFSLHCSCQNPASQVNAVFACSSSVIYNEFKLSNNWRVKGTIFPSELSWSRSVKWHEKKILKQSISTSNLYLSTTFIH